MLSPAEYREMIEDPPKIWPTWFPSSHSIGQTIEKALHVFLPEAMETLLRPEDAVDVIVPGWFDTKPLQTSPPAGEKAKFNGRSITGLVFCTQDSVRLMTHDTLRDRFASPGIYRYAEIQRFAQINFKRSFLQIAAIGPAFELIARGDRHFFVLPTTPTDKYIRIFSNRITGKAVPLWRGHHVQRWVQPGCEYDPVDETGDLRHTPYSRGDQ